MVQRGRPTSAAAMLRSLRGAPSAKERVRVILENLGGGLPVRVACRKLGISPALFHRQRVMFLKAGLVPLEPRSPGRPARREVVENRRVRELEAKIERLEIDLAYTRVREELALMIPWTRRAEKGSRRLRSFWRAPAPSRPPSIGSGGASRGSGSPGGSASASARSTPGDGAGSPAATSAARLSI